ncbi:hypothetical protein SAMN05421803_13334 [Nocardiopsis flavescens]|uniref:Uncharacterized protein n=1 Tax=Nocardiopsis flavescens TaxID=758803 RepID=A0A1M6VBE6_9ACTN|nr:hypothetical protein [Nocardiopsis flavescens]SHK78684.1 hypothetical protein SAMN05421803_13334 [Nocardiopsis flavescens]
MDEEGVLERIRNDGALRSALDLVGDFDANRLDPVEELELPDGSRPTPVAGCAAGGTYFLCGPPGTRRPVLYAGSEGQATLVAADLAEALAVVTASASWQDALGGHPLDELEEEFRADHPGLDEARERIRAALDLPALSPEEARERLFAAARRTVPGFLPAPVGHDGRYEPMPFGGRTPR